jgi:carboxyl-terminal processing protease
MRKIRNLVLGVLLVTVVGSGSYLWGRRNLAQSKDKFDLSLMWQVKGELEGKFLEKEKIQNQNLMYGAVEGMVSALGDPYTVFLPPLENKSANEDLEGKFGGVGIQLGYKDKTLAVMTPLPKTPAAQAGIRAGDLILKITDKKKGVDRDTGGISLNEAVDLIRGEVGTQVILKIFREGDKEAMEVTLVRDNIVISSVELEWVKKVAWIKLYKFSDQLFKDWPKVVGEVRTGNPVGIVLDLRNNPGGYLSGSVMVGSDFIESGVIVRQELANGKTEDYSVDQSRRGLVQEKLVVLVNGGSASAAEILAGTLKESGRAKLVGEKTFGKGTVQQPENFADGSGLHVTVAKWLLPSGRNIHGTGVEPDMEVKYEAPKEATGSAGSDNQLGAAIDVLLL